MSAAVKCFTASSVISFSASSKLFSLQLEFMSAAVKWFTPSTVTLLLARPKLFSLQLEFMSAAVKCFTPSTVILLAARYKLLSLQLVFVSALVKCSTPLSVIPLSWRAKLFSLQLLFMSAVVKYFKPSFLIALFLRFKLFRLQKPWLWSLPPNNLEISIQPKSEIWLNSKLKCKIFSPLDWSAWTNVKQSRGDKRQSPKSSALQSIWANLLWTSKLDELFSYMQLNKVTTSSLSSWAGQQVTVSVRASNSSLLTFSTLVVSLVTDDNGRRPLKISVDCSSCSSSPATNCITTFHAPSLMWSEANVFSSSWLMVSTKYFAAKNSCTVRWRKQYWAFPSFKPLLVSGKRWNKPFFSRSLTSCDSKTSLPCWIPLKAISPSLLNTLVTASGNSLNGLR